MLCGVELAQNRGEDGDVGQLFEGDVRQVEIEREVVDAVRAHVVAQAGQGRALVQARGRLFFRGRNVRELEQRQRCQVFGRIGRFLQAVQFSALVHDGLGLLGRERCLLRGELFCFLIALGRFFRHDLHAAAVVVLEHELAQQLFEVAFVQTGVHAGERVFPAQGVHGRIVVVKPASQAVHGVHDAFRRAEVHLAEQELLVLERRFDERMVDAFGRQSFDLSFEDGTELVKHVRLAALELHHEQRLQARIVHECVRVARKLCVEQHFLKRALVAAHERVHEDSRRKHARAVRGVADDVAERRAGVLGRGHHALANAPCGTGRLAHERVRGAQFRCGCRFTA